MQILVASLAPLRQWCLTGMTAKAQRIINGLFTSARFHDHHSQPGDAAETSHGLQLAVWSRRKEDLLQPLPKAVPFTVGFLPY